jgi:hypothetical protein
MAAIEIAHAGDGLPRLLWEPSPNFSARSGGIKPRLLVIHDAEGSYAGSVNWFTQFKSHVSAHLVVKDDGSEVTQQVVFASKAWHACFYNSLSIGIEMAGFESKGFADVEYLATARVAAYLCHRFGIPVRASKGPTPGIARHYDLGALGGGHRDPTTDPLKWQWFIGLVAKQAAEGGWPETLWGR